MKKLKIFLLLSILLCFGFILSFEVHASSPLPYLTFQSTSGFTLKVNDTTKHWDGTLYYSTDTTTWVEWDGTTTLSSVGNKLYLRGTGNKIITGSSSAYRWVLVGSNIECIGNIENLLDYETVASGNHPAMTDYCYYSIFKNCTGLTTAPELPATILADHCYDSMFSGCTGLTTAPSLPATTLASNCYQNMFYGCTGLTTAPSLPATTLADYCYQNMFRNCTGLTTVPSLPATTLADYCYYNMFNGCTALKVSTTQTESYQYAWRIPTSGTGTEATNWNYQMLISTGGTFTGDPNINTTYYVENPPVEDPNPPSGFNITFEENGGTSVTDLSGQTVLPNPLPTTTKSGYTFVNWYYDSAFTQKANAGDTIQSNVTLYAKWQLNTYTITYNSNGGSNIPQASDVTQLPDPLPTPTKSGYTFEGWYYDSDFANEAFAGDLLTSDVTLYAKWDVLEIEPGYILPQSKVLINLTYNNTGGEKYGIVRYTIGTYGEILFTAVEEAPPTYVTSAGIGVSILNGSWGINLPFGDYVNQNFGTRTGLLSIGIIIDFSDATEVERTITNIYTTGTLEISIEILTDEVFFYENGYDTAREYYGWEDNGYWYSAEEARDMGYEDAREIYGYYDSTTDEWLSVDDYVARYGTGNGGGNGTGSPGASDFYANFDKYFIPAMIIVFAGAIVLTLLKVFKGRE